MDVNQDTVSKVMRDHNSLRLIHGHTHRPDVHNFEISGQPAQRFVLAAWSKDAGEILSWTNKGYQIEVI